MSVGVCKSMYRTNKQVTLDGQLGEAFKLISGGLSEFFFFATYGMILGKML